MNQRPTLLKPVGPASLADEEDFQLGDIWVRPSIREVEAGSIRENLEPRVMQVLVALARANGAVLSRDELIRQCWGGRIVGEDAINRCVSKLRQLSELGGGKAFEIDTIPRVGYRLRELQGEPAEARPPVVSAAAAAAAAPETSTWPVLRMGPRAWRWRMLTVIATVIVTVVVASLYFYLRREPEWIVAESHLPFISTPAVERYPALSPDGTMIAYSAGSMTTNRRIYLRLMKGGDPIQLTHDAHDASSPAWSPDSKIIAYAIFEQGHPCRIMEIPIPAGQSRQVGRCRVSERSSLAFDRSGGALLFADAPQRGAANRIYKLDLDNGHISPVTQAKMAEAFDGEPSASPNGSEVLYNRGDGTKNEIRIVSLADHTERLVAAFNDGDANAAWSTDGGTIFISRSRDSENALWAYPVGGGAPWRILSSGEYLGRLSAGPNGLLAMEMQYPGGQLVAVTPHSDFPPRPIDSGGLRTWCVDYSLDGTFLATGWHSESFGIWISGPNGALHELLSLPDGQACTIRWSPDGTRFAYLQRTLHGFDVPVMTRAGQPIARLHFSGKDSGLLDWTGDGKSILTSRKDKQGWRIWRTDLATPDKSVPITAYGWWSPRVHGDMLFAEKDGATGVWRIDGTPRRMTDGPTPEASDVYNIAGDRLIYSDTTDPEHPMFSAVNVNGGPKDRLTPLPHGQINFTFGVNPKSGDIVYTQDTQDTDIGLLRLVKR